MTVLDSTMYLAAGLVVQYVFPVSHGLEPARAFNGVDAAEHRKVATD